MKKQILGFVIGALILPFGTIAQDHPGHNMEMDQEEMAIKHYDVSPVFQEQLNAVYRVGLELNKSFIAEDVPGVRDLAGTMIHQISEVDMSLVEGAAHMTWMMYVEPLSANLSKITVSADLSEQRKLYAGISEVLYKVIKSYGIGETAYYQYCPMAKSSWLNDSEEVNNPYYGNKMLKCGSTKEVLN